MSVRWHLFYLAIIAALLAALLWQGARLERAASAAQAIAAEPLYRALRAAPERYQIVDLRAADVYEDGHLPQAIRLERSGLAQAAIDRYRLTIVVTEDGDPAAFADAAQALRRPVNLEGGMMQWRMSRLPEVSGLTDTGAIRRGKPG